MILQTARNSWQQANSLHLLYLSRETKQELKKLNSPGNGASYGFSQQTGASLPPSALISSEVQGPQPAPSPGTSILSALWELKSIRMTSPGPHESVMDERRPTERLRAQALSEPITLTIHPPVTGPA